MGTALLISGAAGAVGFVLVFLLDGATRPDYAVRRQPVSALALGPRGWLQTANFVVAGALVAAGGLGVLLVGAGGGRVASGLSVIVLGAALIASGAFRMDPMRGYPPGAPPGDPASFSRSHELHDYAGTIVFGGLPVAALLHAVVLDATPWRIWSAVAGIGAGVLAGWFAAAWERDDPHTGLIQRGFLVVGLGWSASVLLQHLH